jgi:processive 1,2-diacylglycerol beta-glucosyltransferase
MRTVLILHASCGAGHRRAAEAIQAASRDSRAADRVLVRDVLDLSPALHRLVYRGGYLGLVRHMPAAWRHLYAVTDRPGAGSTLRRALQSIDRATVGPRLRRFIQELAPDVVLTTHFLPLALLGGRQGSPAGAPLHCVVTDYRAHATWASPAVERYAVATEAARRDLIRLGIDPARIHPTGIPVHPDFERIGHRRRATDPGPIRRLLILSGGCGIGRLHDLLPAIDSAFDDVEVTVSAGSSRRLADALAALALRLKNRIRIVGMVASVEALFAEADLVLTKPGGLTVTESLVAGLPIVLLPGIPGQETGNARALVDEGAARSAATPAEAVDQIDILRRDPIARQRMRLAQARLARPGAARVIFEGALGRPSPADPRIDTASRPVVAGGGRR